MWGSLRLAPIIVAKYTEV